jgi:hypothetical protein
MVLPMSTASAPISIARAISPIMSPACVPTMPPPKILPWLSQHRWPSGTDEKPGIAEPWRSSARRSITARGPRIVAVVDHEAALWCRPGHTVEPADRCGLGGATVPRGPLGYGHSRAGEGLPPGYNTRWLLRIIKKIKCILRMFVAIIY